MSWIINGELDSAITLVRSDYERITKKSISKKDMLMKLIYDNENTRRLLESNGFKINKKLFKMPKL
jgi:hypothetical protein